MIRSNSATAVSRGDKDCFTHSLTEFADDCSAKLADYTKYYRCSVRLRLVAHGSAE